jgi:hypothetical protein
MSNMPYNTFECHLYISHQNKMRFRLPAESGPQRIALLEPLDHDKLIDPRFRRLLAAFESLPQSSLQIVQV